MSDFPWEEWWLTLRLIEEKISKKTRNWRRHGYFEEAEAGKGMPSLHLGITGTFGNIFICFSPNQWQWGKKNLKAIKVITLAHMIKIQHQSRGPLLEGVGIFWHLESSGWASAPSGITGIKHSKRSHWRRGLQFRDRVKPGREGVAIGKQSSWSQGIFPQLQSREKWTFVHNIHSPSCSV